MKKALLGMFFVGFVATESFAVRLGKYPSLKQQDLFTLQMYVFGVGEGLSWANARVRTNKLPLLYCQPEHLAITKENFMQILDDEIKRPGTSYKDQTPIELILLEGLIRTFPCTNSN